MTIKGVSSIDGALNENGNWVDSDELLELLLFEGSDNVEVSVYVTRKGNYVVSRSSCWNHLYTDIDLLLKSLKQRGVFLGDVYKYLLKKSNESSVGSTLKRHCTLILQKIHEREM